MKDLLKIILIISWVLLPLDEVLAQGNPATDSPPSATGQKPIEVTADAVQQEAAEHIIKARGNVIVTYEGKTIRADRLIVNTETGIGEASGHVVITEEGSRLTAQRSKFNLKTHQAKLYNTRGVLARKTTGSILPGAGAPPPALGSRPQQPNGTAPPPQKVEYYVKGKELVKIGENHYKATQASLTTCKGKLPDWMIQAESADMIVGDRALFKNGIIKIRDVPVFYLPIGYVPLDQERKSGFLTPIAGNSSINGNTVSNAYYWAINRESDATFFIDYMSTRGVRPGIEYRYTPEKTTRGVFSASYLDDKSLDQQFYKVNWTHNQVLPGAISINGKLDLMGNNNPDKTFNDNTTDRTRRNTDSFLSANKTWSNTSLDLLTRYQSNTVDQTIDDKFGLLPQAVLRTQKNAIGNTSVYFSQESSFSGFYTNLDPSRTTSDYTTIQRFDVHPQLSLPLKPTPWLSVTPTVGARETYYSQGIDANDYHNRLNGFSRELLDVGTVIEGPKFTKIYFAESSVFSKLKHIIEPRVAYTYISDRNESENRQRIKVFDNVDLLGSVNRTTYYLTQRLLQKRVINDELSETRDILKFEISQSYDARATTVSLPTGYSAFFPQGHTTEPFSPIRFDLNSRFTDELMINGNSTYNPHSGQIDTVNFELGVKPSRMLSFLIERRYTRDATTFITGTTTLTLPKGWKFQYSSRYDEVENQFQENDVSLGFNDPCRCWGISFDYIKRNNYNLGLAQPETKFMFNLNLLGLGKFGSGSGSGSGTGAIPGTGPIHRTF